jgi:hypothetical protein
MDALDGEGDFDQPLPPKAPRAPRFPGLSAGTSPAPWSVAKMGGVYGDFLGNIEWRAIFFVVFFRFFLFSSLAFVALPCFTYLSLYLSI